MNIFIMIAIIITNAIAVALIYQFVKRMQKMDKIIFIAASFAINYILVSIVYWLSGLGMDSTITEQSKNYITYLFVPVNVILFVPILAILYNKYKENKIKKNQLQQRYIWIGIIILMILVGEYFYFKSVIHNIKEISETQAEQNAMLNETIQNTILNEVTQNTQENEVSNDVIQGNNEIPYVNKAQ